MTKRTRTILMGCMAVGFLLGLGILIYPLFSNLWNARINRIKFQEYDRIAVDLSDESLAGEWEKARAYNGNLAGGALTDGLFAGASGQDADQNYMDCLNVKGDGIMGYLEIPKIDATMAIYHTTDEDVLQKGAGHVYGSSLPVGGESTHAVLAAHRGLPGQSLFTDIDQLEEGDQFYIHVLDEIHAYEIDQIRTVLPENVDGLNVTPGEDYVTLVTCTPYGVNSHRLLVRGHRVPYGAENAEEQRQEKTGSIHTNYVLWIVIGLAATAVCIFIVAMILQAVRKKKHREKEKTSQEKPETDSGDE